MSEPASAGEAIASAERWFLHHGLPWFVDDVRGDVHRRLRKARILRLLLGALALAAAAAVGTAFVADASTSVAVAISVLAVRCAIYALTALRASVIAAWALRRALGSLGLLLPLATRALPMLLLFITFLFINTEVWQVASALHGGVLWTAILFFAAAAVGFLVPRLAQELDEFDDRVTADDVLAGTAGTRLEAAASQCVDDLDLPDQAQVTGLQMVNLVVVLVIAQVVQVLLLSIAVFVFFIIFGVVAIDDSVVVAWLGHGPSYPPGPHWVSIELIRVATFLAGFSGLYFTVTAITDDIYRREFFDTVMRELQRAVAVRAIYRHLRG